MKRERVYRLMGCPFERVSDRYKGERQSRREPAYSCTATTHSLHLSMVAQTTTTTLNNSALIASAALLSSSSSRTSSPSPSRHSRSCSEPVLARSLPPLSHLEAVGQQSAKDAKHRQILADALAVAVETPLDAYDAPPPEAALVGATGGGAAPGNGSRGSTGKGKPPGTRFESYHVLQAIEKRQTMLLFEIRCASAPTRCPFAPHDD